jgi:hypothetical protein
MTGARRDPVRGFFWFQAGVFLVVLSCLPLSAQRNTASIFGTVTDASGAIIPGVSVRITNDDTGQESASVSDALGNFILPDLAPGRYTLSASMKGFKQFVRKDLRLDVDERPQINVVLQVGDVAEVVTVNEAAPVVDATHANVGGVVGNVFAQELPLNGRQFLQLGLLMPGTSPAAGGQTIARGGGPRNIGVQAAGNRATNNDYLIDGVDSFGFRFKNTSLRPSVASIEEFKILESPYDPQYGTASGMQVTVITKSGTNSFHGELFEFLRNDKMDARNFFNAKKAPYRQNQFGGALGGPVIKNKTFFFASVESFRSRQGLAVSGQVPTDAQKAGNFSSDPVKIIDPLSKTPFPNNIIPDQRISEVSKKFLQYWPEPNTALASPNFINAASGRVNDDQYVFRGDHTFSDRWKLFARYSFSNVDTFTPGAMPGFAGTASMTVQNAVLGATCILSPKTFLDIRLGYNRENAINSSEQIGKGHIAQFGIPGVAVTPQIDGIPNVSVTGFSTIGDLTNAPEGRVENSEQLQANYTHIVGRHTLKAGGNVWPVQLNRVILSAYDRGVYSFTNAYTSASTGFPDFLLGMMLGSNRQEGFIREDALTTLYNLYGGDDFRVSPRLTVSLGLRYELRPAFIDRHNHIATWLPQNGGRFVVAGDPNNGFTGRANRALYTTPAKNFAPRVSLAYDLFGNGKTILRTGYGIFYNLAIFNGEFFNALSPPYVYLDSYTANPGAGQFLTFANPFPSSGALGGQPGGQFVAWNLKSGYVQQWSFGIQRQLAENLGLDVSYVANKGTSLDGVRKMNQGALPTVVNPAYYRPDPNFGTFTVMDSFGDSNYESLQAKLTRRFSKGATFIAGYTYGHAIDNANGEGGGSGSSLFAQDNNNIRAERGNSDYDVRHRFTLSGVYDLPFGPGKHFLGSSRGAPAKIIGGWQATVIYQTQTGFPFTVTQSGNRSLTNASNERANRLCNGNLPGDQRTRARWFDTSCFALSPLGTFGNGSRNILRYPGQNNLDFSLLKSMQFTESKRLEFRAEFFNLPNHTQFLLTGGIGSNVSSRTTFGVVSQAQDPRITQLSLRFLF